MDRSRPLPGAGVRVVVLWQQLSGYAHASFGALRDLGVDVRVVHRATGADAPFDDAAVTERLATRSWSGAPDAKVVEQVVAEADPHAVLMSSWHPPGYRRVVRRWRGRTLRVLCMDNQWWATPKQRLGVMSAPVLIRPTFDAAFVGGERGADLARRFGFPRQRIITGLYTCDHDLFAAVAKARGTAAPNPAFAFVGRLVEAKGVDVLAEGYRRYRDIVDDPWPLLVGGTGPGAAALQGVRGVDLLGFVQPRDLPALLGRAGCLVLPSRFEPWGVVVHEATAAGLPVVCTDVVGAASRLVLDGYNGVVTDADDPDALARGLASISTASDDERRATSLASRSLAAQYTPQRWARHLLSRIGAVRGLVGLGALPRSRPSMSPAPAVPHRSGA